MAGFMMSIYGIHTSIVNRKFLPPELQAPLWRDISLWVFSGFFAFFTVVTILDRVLGVKINDPALGAGLGALFLVVFGLVGFATRGSAPGSGARVA